MINDEMYETCKDCPYYYGEINWCMYGEEDVPDNLEKKSELDRKENKNAIKDKNNYNKNY